MYILLGRVDLKREAMKLIPGVTIGGCNPFFRIRILFGKKTVARNQKFPTRDMVFLGSEI